MVEIDFGLLSIKQPRDLVSGTEPAAELPGGEMIMQTTIILAAVPGVGLPAQESGYREAALAQVARGHPIQET